MFELLTEIVSNGRLTHDTWLMALRSAKIAQAAKPGQFVMIRVRSGLDPLLRRPFSICGVKEDLFLVLYRVVGKGTGLMTELRQGERVWVLGPLGKSFALPDERVSRLLVGGGIGIAPLVFLAQGRQNQDLTLMTGFRSAKDIIPPREITGEERGFAVATDDGTKGHCGPVTDLLDAALRKNAEGRMVYACGPKPMLKRVAEIARTLKVPCQVSLEARMACGLGACQGCAVKASAASGRSYWYVCKEGPVFDAEAIDWELI
ncbi:MAG: dihydroorotate dehydrogenase electron transfer subunit [Desulfobacterota bacterium]|jgi:dihydroorotate dehydrogenase electron transfer subunit|nr:dihydroorotate dehydrogenase electron transfer subunit [Thermodesulfobacteriota bacterium]